MWLVAQSQSIFILQHFFSLRSESARPEEKGWGQRADGQVQADGLLHRHGHDGRAVAKIFWAHARFIRVFLSAHGHG